MVVVDGSTEISVIALCGLQAEIIQTKKKKEKQTVCQLLQSFFILTLAPRAAQFRPNIVTSTERRRWEGVFFFFFQIFYRDCFHRRSRDSGKWRGIASDVFYNDPRSASGSGRAGFLFAREDFWILFRREDPVSFDSGGNVFKEFLIFRIFLFFITEFGCSGKLQN